MNRHDRYLGSPAAHGLLTEDPDRTVGEVMDTTSSGIAAVDARDQVAALFQDRDLVSAAVVVADETGCSAASRSTTSST